jgi:hypothetical protein
LREFIVTETVADTGSDRQDGLQKAGIFPDAVHSTITKRLLPLLDTRNSTCSLVLFFY